MLPIDSPSERASLFKLQGIFKDQEERERYIADGWVRIQVVLDILSKLHRQGIRRVLELGSNPYLMTMLMQHRFDFELELANYFAEELTAKASVHVAELDGKRLEFPFRHFNIERDGFPYSSRSFDCVLFCEILEHLLESPDHAVDEMAQLSDPADFSLCQHPMRHG